MLSNYDKISLNCLELENHCADDEMMTKKKKLQLT